ncbi:MAG: patatin-like phospholipase family protein [Flavobacteriales bacterium]
MSVPEHRTGITLSGGAARGITHLGVLKALEEEGIRPDVISGVSGGAILGALYASGWDPEDILESFAEEKLFRNIQLSFPRKGFMSMNGLFDILEKYLKARDFSELEIPLYVTSTDFKTGKQAVFHEGDLFHALKASSAIPILFKPVEDEKGNVFVDGGLVSNLPVEPIEGMCQKLIGVNVNPIGEMDEFPNMFSVLERTLHLSIWANVQKNVEKCDLFIEPEGLRQYNIFNLSKVREIYSLGYNYTREFLEERTIDRLMAHQGKRRSI